MCAGRQIVNKCLLFVYTIRIKPVAVWHAAACAVSHRKRYFRPEIHSRYWMCVLVCVYRRKYYCFSGYRLNKSYRIVCVCVQVRDRPSGNDTPWCCRRASGRVCQLTHVSLLSTHTHTHTHTFKYKWVCASVVL